MSSIGIIVIVVFILLVAGGIVTAVLLTRKPKPPVRSDTYYGGLSGTALNTAPRRTEAAAGGYASRGAAKDDVPRRPCPFCGEMIKAESSFCSFCGKKVEPVRAAAAPAELPRPDERCPFCDSILPKDAPFCPACGGSINRAPASGSSAIPEPDEPTPWPIPPAYPEEESDTVRPPIEEEELTRSSYSRPDSSAAPASPDARPEPSFETRFTPAPSAPPEPPAFSGLCAPSDDDL